MATNRDRKIEATREMWVTAVKRKNELVHELWKVEEIENKTKEQLKKYGEYEFQNVVQESADVVKNYRCDGDCNSCNLRCKLGDILYSDTQSSSKRV